MAKKQQSREFTARQAMDALLEEIDEERARRLRQAYGQRHWLVSWQPAGDGSWLARLSGPGVLETVERTGRSRLAAIEEAALAFRAELAAN
jgi:hypothetical protein